MSATTTPPRHWRGWRWIKRGTLGLVGFILLAVGAALVVIHTDWGRGILRTQVEARLNAMFTGGATLGRIEGSPFSELTLRDLVINGPDKQPAISVKTLRVAVAILPLISHQARVVGVIAEDVDVDLKRNPDGTMQIADLMVPGPKSAWSVALPRVELRRAHLKVDTGKEVVNLDDLTIDARAKMPYQGPIDAGVELGGQWRERGHLPFSVRTIVHKDDQGLTVPALLAFAGDLMVAGSDLHMVTVEGKPPRIGGTVAANASIAAVQRLMPEVVLPADVQLVVTATPGDAGWTAIQLSAKVDQTPIRYTGDVDLEAKHARGELVAGALDLTKLSGGKLTGTAAATAKFDVRPGGAKSLPIATATITGWGAIDGVPRTELAIDVTSAGERAKATIDAKGEGVSARLAASVRSVGELLQVEQATLVASTSNPYAASGGKAPVRGSLQVNLAASGQIKPALSLAVAGTVDGRHLRMADLSVGQVHVSLDASKLPNRPFGKAHVQIVDLVRGTMQLGALTIDATDRADGKVAVQLRSRPHQAPWLIDLDALVTPPAEAGARTVEIDLQRHRIRAGNNQDWTGTTGHVELGPEKIVIKDLRSASALGNLAVDGSFDRVRGDIAANVVVNNVSLDSLGQGYHGKLDANVVVSRKANAWDADVKVNGAGLAIDPSTTQVDTHATIGLHGRQLLINADAQGLGLGAMKLALDLEAPANVVDPAAWKRLGRAAIRTSQLTLQGIEIRKVAELAKLEGDYAGRIDGDIQVTATTAGGRVEVHSIEAPALRGVKGVSAVLDLSQPSLTELVPTLNVTAEGIGRVQAQAQLTVPEKMFDPAAWKALGRGALKGATVKADDITIDPATLDRLGIVSELRAKLNVAVELGEAARTFDATVDVAGLRGAPISQPLDIHFDTRVGDADTTVKLDVKTKGAVLLALDGKVPLTIRSALDRKDDPEAIKATPLDATLKLARVDAVKLLAVFGRNEITGGVLDGEVKLGGTIAAPTVDAKLTATGLRVPPGPRSKPVRTVDNLTILGSWDGTTAKLSLDGAESDGGKLSVIAEAQPRALRDGSVTIKATKFDLVPLLAFLPGPAGGAAGTLDANLTVKGLDLRNTQLAGEVHLLDGRIPIAPAVGTMRRVKLDAVIADHEVQLGLTGRLGGGDVTMKGGIALDGAAPSGGNATIKLREVAPIGSIEPKINADITAKLTHEDRQWKADLVVDHGLVIVPSDRGEALKPVGAPTDMTFANGKKITRRPLDKAEVPTNPIFLVNIALRSTRVESEEFRGLVKGNLELRADGEALGIVGGIEADSGDLDLFGHRYYIERAGVHFDGPVDPLLDIRITHDFPDVTTITEVRGRASKPELIMTSDPGSYSQGQLLGFLLGGDPGGDPQNSSATDKVAGAGASFVANKLGGYVKSALPIDIDVLRYEAASATSSAAVTVGTWVNHVLFLAYRQHLSARPDENASEGELEYWITRRIVLEGSTGDRGVTGVDLLWRKRY
jgi:translocation and assembly module TamB